MLNGLTRSYIEPKQYEDVVLLGGKACSRARVHFKGTVFSIGKMFLAITMCLLSFLSGRFLFFITQPP